MPRFDIRSLANPTRWVPRRALAEINEAPGAARVGSRQAGADRVRRSTPPDRHKLVVVGGGFAGVHAVKGLKRSPVAITLLDRRNFHLFQPLLYQVATGALSPANIAEPLRTMFAKQKNVETLLGEASDLDPDAREVVLATGQRVAYDSLLVCVGAKGSYFGNDQWGDHAPPLKTLEDATEIRRKIFSAFEAAERTDDPLVRQAMLTFVIVGAGPTGTELAGTLAEIAHETLQDEFRRISPSDATIILVQSGDRVLKGYPDKLSAAALDDLIDLGVTVRLESRVVDVDDDHVKVKTGDRIDTIPTCTVLWAAGVQAAKFGTKVAERTEAQVSRGGQIKVGGDLTIDGYPDIFVAGDMAWYEENGEPLPGVAQVAIQQGKHVAKVIKARLNHEADELEPFSYLDLGKMAMLGRKSAVADIGPLEWTGVSAWLIWLFVHLIPLASFRSRILIVIQWFYSYVSHKRSSRLITRTATLVEQTYDLDDEADDLLPDSDLMAIEREGQTGKPEPAEPTEQPEPAAV